MRLIFLLAVKHQSFLKVGFNTFRIIFPCKMIQSLLMDMIKHPQSTQCSTFAISLAMKLFNKNMINKILHMQ